MSPYPLLGWLITGGLCSIGAALTLLQTHDLYYASQVRKWPSVEGIVLEAQIEGKRGFVPKVAYEYRVDGVTYTDKKRTVFTAVWWQGYPTTVSQKIIAEYEKGKSITVYYNPSASRIRCRNRCNLGDIYQTWCGRAALCSIWILNTLQNRATSFAEAHCGTNSDHKTIALTSITPQSQRTLCKKQNICKFNEQYIGVSLGKIGLTFVFLCPFQNNSGRAYFFTTLNWT